MAQERVIFFRHNAPQGQLSATQVVGLNDDDTLIARPLQLAQHPFFASLGQKAQAFRCLPGQLERLRATFADDFFTRIGDHGFAAMSVVKEGRLLGVFYFDNCTSGKPVDDVVYQQFKTAVSRLCA